MISLVMGVVMASFVWMGNAAELNKRFFWTPDRPRQPLVIEKPKLVDFEDTAFTKLKENEIQRVVNNKAILGLFAQEQVSIERLKKMLQADAARIDASVVLFHKLKKQKSAESPKQGFGYVDVEPIFTKLNAQIFDLQPEVEDVQRKIHDYMLTGKSFPAKQVGSLLKKLQKERLDLFAHFEIDANLKEETITPYHMSAFPHLLLLDAQYHDMQKKILNCF